MVTHVNKGTLLKGLYYTAPFLSVVFWARFFRDINGNITNKKKAPQILQYTWHDQRNGKKRVFLRLNVSLENHD